MQLLSSQTTEHCLQNTVTHLILTAHIKAYSEPRIVQYQCQCYEHNIDTFYLFIDFTEAYYSMLRPKLYEGIDELRIPTTFGQLTMMTMSKSHMPYKKRELTPRLIRDNYLPYLSKI